MGNRLSAPAGDSYFAYDRLFCSVFEKTELGCECLKVKAADRSANRFSVVATKEYGILHETSKHSIL